MRRIILLSTFLILLFFPVIVSQSVSDTSVYLITCGTGTETYSIYGHSALRVVIPGKQTDIVYNWGVFDFDAPNFAWKFAKGRLDYFLGTETMKSFLKTYFYEERYVYSQKINLTPSETEKLLVLINENLKPENVKYRYDFFYDDCSTRIRDLLEKCTNDKLIYAPDGLHKPPTFRDMVGKYQDPFPWMKFGVDLIMGSPGDKKTTYRDRMFLPIDLQRELSETLINRSGKMIPFLKNPDVVLDFEPPVIKQLFLLFPSFVFTIFLMFILILSAKIKSLKMLRIMDISLFAIYSILACMMIFFNFFTDHQQMKANLNILWLNPVVIVCLTFLILDKAGAIWFKVLFYITAAFLILQFMLPQKFNIAIIPLIIILLVRSSVRADFDWNPLHLSNLKEKK